MGCGIGYGYLHRIPVQPTSGGVSNPPTSIAPAKTTVAAPVSNAGNEKENKAANVSTTIAPSLPYVPPLTNTFTGAPSVPSVNQNAEPVPPSQSVFKAYFNPDDGTDAVNQAVADNSSKAEPTAVANSNVEATAAGETNAATVTNMPTIPAAQPQFNVNPIAPPVGLSNIPGVFDPNIQIPAVSSVSPPPPTTINPSYTSPQLPFPQAVPPPAAIPMFTPTPQQQQPYMTAPMSMSYPAAPTVPTYPQVQPSMGGLFPTQPTPMPPQMYQQQQQQQQNIPTTNSN